MIIITSNCLKGFLLRAWALLAMRLPRAPEVWDVDNPSVIVVISSIRGVVGWWGAAVRTRRVPPRSEGVATDTPSDVSRPEVR